jgi:polar amino acid transport system substrate-binding protein
MTAVRTSVVILIALLIGSVCLAAPVGANVDQCAPPGVQSASALPTNLAKAATGPGADRYTTATVEPLTAVNVNTLGQQQIEQPGRHQMARGCRGSTPTRRPSTAR